MRRKESAGATPETEPVVVTLGRRQHRAAADAMAAGHAQYPSFRHVFPDERRRVRALRAFFAATVRDAIPFGSVLAVTDGSRVQAAAVWLPPGAFPWSLARKLAATPTLAGVAVADPRAFPTFLRYGENVERAHPAEAHWYLEALSVRPECQRRGLGSRLVEPILERADAEGAPCYLETSDPANIAFYRRFGFSVVDPPLVVIPDGPPLTAMWRAGPGSTG